MDYGVGDGMKIFLYCSFKSSNGFKESTLDMQSNVLSAGCSKEISDIFCNVSDDVMLLSEDMQGNLLFSLIGEKTSDYTKYLNIIFCDSDYNKICNIFAYTLRNYDLVVERLFSSIEKDMSIPKIEYNINTDVLHELTENAQKEGYQISNIANKGGCLLSYVSLNPNTQYHPECPWSRKLFPGKRSSMVIQADLDAVQGNVEKYMEKLINVLENRGRKNIYRVLLCLGIIGLIIFIIVTIILK